MAIYLHSTLIGCKAISVAAAFASECNVTQHGGNKAVHSVPLDDAHVLQRWLGVGTDRICFIFYTSTLNNHSASDCCSEFDAILRLLHVKNGVVLTCRCIHVLLNMIMMTFFFHEWVNRVVP